MEGEGHFEFNVLPFGLQDAPAIFQRTVEFALKDAKEFCLNYLDDLVIFSKDFKSHLTHLKRVFDLLRKAGLKLKAEKCTFGVKELHYLGHIVTKDGVKTDPKKIEAMTRFPAPKNLKQLRTYLGLTGYYRKYIRNYAKIAQPLTLLTKQTEPWAWGPTQQKAFSDLKTALSSAPILGFVDVEKDYIIDSDASDFAVGAVLSQVQDVKIVGNDGKYTYEPREVVLAFTSKKLLERETRYSTIEKELLGILHALETFHEYIYGRRVLCRTDHAPLQYLWKKKNPSGRLGRWLLATQKYDLDVRYRPGRVNSAADAMSRNPDLNTNAVCAITATGIPGRADWIRSQQTDEHCSKLRNSNEAVKNKRSIKETKDKLLLQNGKVVVPEILRRQVIERFHDHPLSCHMGIKRTVERIKAEYIWPKIRDDVTRFVNGCKECATCKSYGLQEIPLRPIEASRFVWERVQLDIKGPLAETYRGNRFILVMIEASTRYVELVPLSNQRANTVAKAIIERLILRYGTPFSILTDLGTNFQSKLLKQICNLLQIKQLRTVAYKPSTNGGAERFMRTMGELIRVTTTKDPADWDLMLPYIQFSYNTSIHSSTRQTPHSLLYGADAVQPDSIEDVVNRTNFKNREDDEFFLKWRTAAETAREVFSKAQLVQKKYYDRSRKIKNLSVGDRVLLRYMRLAEKSKPKWEGPYFITKRLGECNYVIKKLGSETEMVVHANRIKLFPERDSGNESVDESESDSELSENESDEDLIVETSNPKKKTPIVPSPLQSIKINTTQAEEAATQQVPIALSHGEHHKVSNEETDPESSDPLSTSDPDSLPVPSNRRKRIGIPKNQRQKASRIASKIRPSTPPGRIQRTQFGLCTNSAGTQNKLNDNILQRQRSETGLKHYNLRSSIRKPDRLGYN